jgi:hypothetical protein
MAKLTEEVFQNFVGMLAASGAVVSKQIWLRDPPQGNLSAGLQPSTLSDLPRLLSRGDHAEIPAHRIARLSSAALVYSVDKKSTLQPSKILRNEEARDVLDVLQKHKEGMSNFDRKRKRVETDRSCSHCRLLYRSLYRDTNRWGDVPPVAVVNHAGRIDVAFDPETNIAQANIEHFQLILPTQIAKQLIGFAHPLHWADVEGTLFQRSDPVDADGVALHGSSKKAREDGWHNHAKNGEAFIREEVAFPLNENLSSKCENIIKFTGFEHAQNSLLKYDYSLERCIRSNFGIAWEPSGLDIDSGRYEGRMMRLEDRDIELAVIDGPLQNLHKRDILEMDAQRGPLSERGGANDELLDGWPPQQDNAKPEEIGPAVSQLRTTLENHWESEFCLLDVSASKKLHFTLPENGPIELWYAMTWMAPAFLLTFLNSGVCLAPHMLIEEAVASGKLKRRQLMRSKSVYESVVPEQEELGGGLSYART